MSIKATTFPPPDDPGWFLANVWDCSACGVGRISEECLTCVSCDAPRPEGAVYEGRCWGMKIDTDPTINLRDLPSRPLITSPRGESLQDEP
jgi:hypothetical protein